MKLIYTTFILLVGAAIVSCSSSTEKKAEKKAYQEQSMLAVNSTGNTMLCGGFNCNPPAVTDELPKDACNSFANQQAVNCFAWNNFLALNWKNAADYRGKPDTSYQAAQYGMPGDLSPTVWESYMDLQEVFRNTAPDPWNKNYTASTDVKQFKRLSKASQPLAQNEESPHLDEMFQAQGTWLTATNGKMVWYEVKINEEEFDFINNNKLYDPEIQNQYAAAHQGIFLPASNSTQGLHGAMELKAAWLEVDDSEVETYAQRFKLSKGMVPSSITFDTVSTDPLRIQPSYGDYKESHLALVGLHIIRKMSDAQQLVWMTFEHIDNAPTAGAVDKTKTYTFYNPDNKDKVNQPPVPNVTPLDQPVQVMRTKENALPEDIQQLNASVQQTIRDANPKSVWQYYRLINVQWPESPVPDSQNNKTAPLLTGGITPKYTANATMETYAQGNNCMSCHRYGSVVDLDTKEGKETKNYATGYSFVFGNAKKQLDKPKEVVEYVKNMQQ